MIYADLERLDGRGQDEGSVVLAVGWLTSNPFPKKEPIPEFLENLFILCQEPVEQTRGFHVCSFCLEPVFGPMIVRRGTKSITLGTAEIRVRGIEPIVYSAPTLIYHYVADHHYAPPDEFVEAVLSIQRR